MHLMQDRLDLGRVYFYNSFGLSLVLIDNSNYSTGKLCAGRKGTSLEVVETKLQSGEVICLYANVVAIGKYKRDI